MMEEIERGATLDAALISAAQKVEHYEIATYGTLATFAEIMGHQDAKDLLGQTLDEEKEADEKLTQVAGQINFQAEAAGEGEEQERAQHGHGRLAFESRWIVARPLERVAQQETLTWVQRVQRVQWVRVR